MNLGSQIKKYWSELSMSQDELAEKIFVSRQSISNWENDKTYPNILSEGQHDYGTDFLWIINRR